MQILNLCKTTVERSLHSLIVVEFAYASCVGENQLN